jgi:hypothetical protein
LLNRQGPSLGGGHRAQPGKRRRRFVHEPVHVVFKVRKRLCIPRDKTTTLSN